MVKATALSRPTSQVTRPSPASLRRVHRNLDPVAHPHRRAREYTRAVNAAKLDRMFAAPLLGSLGPNGHSDGVTSVALGRTSSLHPLVSGDVGGTVKCWDLPSRRQVWTADHYHRGEVKGVALMHGARHAVSCGVDGRMCLWNLWSESSGSSNNDGKEPVKTWGPNPGGCYQSIDADWSDPETFVTASNGGIDLWTSLERSHPTASFPNGAGNWGDDTVTCVRCNPAQPNVIGHCTRGDRGLGLHDLRTQSALRKTTLRMAANDLQWNPMEPLNVAVACEDHRAYVFDFRKLTEAVSVYVGHVDAVLSISWAPTGREFCTGSYDRTMRIFDLESSATNGGRARDVYHAKRMQRVFTVNYTCDNSYIVSGSDDTNLRLWKARASEPVHHLKPREERALQYRQTLVEKFKYTPEVGRIHRQRKLPKMIQKRTKQEQIVKESKHRKLQNRIAHSTPGTVKVPSKKKDIVVKEIE